MSRLFPERLRVRLAPGALQVGEQRIAWEASQDAEPWQGAVARLAALELPRSRVTVELSSHLVRYALVPWSAAVATPLEEERYLRHHFARVHGEKARGWAVRAAEAAGAAPRLAAAIDGPLLGSLKEAFKGKKAKLVSVQPSLMSRFNAARKAVPRDGAWLVLAEPDRACIALHAGRSWRAVQNARGEWRAALERERLRAEGAVPSLVLLSGAAAPAPEAGWQFRELPA